MSNDDKPKMSRSEKLKLQAFKNVQERKIENSIKIKVVINELRDEEIIEGFTKILEREYHGNAQKFFEKEFKGLLCDECKEDSKGVVVFSANSTTKSGVLYYKDFCCAEFEIKAKRKIK